MFGNDDDSNSKEGAMGSNLKKKNLPTESTLPSKDNKMLTERKETRNTTVERKPSIKKYNIVTSKRKED